MGIMSDLLEWNRIDPVDEYEIHRNNLIYNNYQHNRNPFIDFPDWAEYIWGNEVGVKSADPSVNPIATSGVIYEGKIVKSLSFESGPTQKSFKADATFSSAPEGVKVVATLEDPNTSEASTADFTSICSYRLDANNKKLVATYRGISAEIEVSIQESFIKRKIHLFGVDIPVVALIGAGAGLVLVVIVIVLLATGHKKAAKKIVSAAKKTAKQSSKKRK